MKIYAISLAICLSMVLAVCVCADINDGLISVWAFDDGTAKDSAGSNHGTLNGGAKPVDGIFGKAIDFNGMDAFVEIPHDKSMEAIADGMSVSAWVYIRTFPQNPNHAGVIFKGEHIGWGSNYAFRIATREQGRMGKWESEKVGRGDYSWSLCT